MCYDLIRPLLFQCDPEVAHDIALKSLKFVPALFFKTNTVYKPVTLMGIKFANSVGLAAGLDKDGEYIDALAKLGFGFIEIGTVTPRPQSGSPKPRLFRYEEQQAIINRMGFNNRGVDYTVECLRGMKYKGVIGVNIGKNLSTSIEDAVADYLTCMRKVYPYASYITVNISSPNTPGLRGLQFGELFTNLLKQLKDEQSKLAAQTGHYVPLVIKLAPDIKLEQLEHIAKQLCEYHLDGVIATNTTPEREGLDEVFAKQAGGLSGKPLFKAATEKVSQLTKLLDGQIPIIATGGILSGSDAQAKMQAGASLVQVYTGLIYKGPKLIKEVAAAI